MGWTDKGSAEGAFSSLAGSLLGGIHDHSVENTATGETAVVYTVGDQTVDEAVAEGQFKDD